MTVINGEKRPLPIVDAITLLLVAGGGGGGGPGGGGGGAGGLLMLDNYTVSDGVTYAISIGAGGAGTTLATATGANGSNSEFNQPFQELSYSNYFDGSGDQLTVPASSSLDLTGDFTIEFWVNAQASSYMVCNGTQSGSGCWYFYFNASTGVITYAMAISTWAGLVITTPINSMTTNTWTHIALTRAGSSFKLFVNGVVKGSSTNSGSLINTGRVTQIGYYTESTGTSYLTGYLSNIRIVKGTAVYTSEFIPPTSPLTAIANTSLLTCQSSTIKDNSTNNFTITKNGDVAVTTVTPFDNLNPMELKNASTYFDGNGDYLSFPGNAAFSITTSTTPFTVEFWAYPTAARGVIFTEQAVGPANNTVVLIVALLDSGGNFNNHTTTTNGKYITLGWYSGSAYATAAVANQEIQLNQWSHIVVTFTGSTSRIYINGINVTNSTPTPSTTWGITGTGGDAWFIGKKWQSIPSDNGEFYTGYISNFRFVRGTAVYTGEFIPPTSPLTAIANTSLLTCQNNIIVDNSTNNFTITKNGDVKTALTTPFNETYTSDLVNATYFDGTGDSLYLTSTQNLTGAFTAECWAYFNTVAGDPCLLGVYTPTNNQVIRVVGGVVMFKNDTFELFGTTAVPIKTWVHLATTRDSSNVVRLFLNGVLQASGTRSNTVSYKTIGSIEIYNYLNGYISNLRVVSGTTLYTTNFTPPTQPLTAIPGTGLLTCQDKAFIDNSINNFTITKNGDTAPAVYRQTNNTIINQNYEQSTVFNGSSTYLFIPPTDIFNFATSTIPLTVEAWIYIKGTGGTIVTEGHTGTGSITFCLTLGPSGNTTSNAVWFGYWNGSSWITAAYATTLVQNTWYHLAGVYTGTSLNLYVNGILAATTGASALPTAANHGILIGRRWDTVATPYFNGYIKDVRIVKGTAVYTSNFIPSREPLTAIPNTILLTCQNSEILDNSTYNHALVQYGPILTSVESPNYSLKAIGGGGGGTYNGGASLAGVQGGSGGGAPGTGSGQGRAAGANIIDQGNVGGAGVALDGQGVPGGGGGISLPGGAASPNIAGYGGPGYNWQINQYGYSTYFNGTSDYLTFDSLVTSQGVFGGSAAFTFEAWVYPLGSTWMLITNLNTTSSQFWWEIYHSASAGLALHFGIYGSSSASASTGSAQLVPNYAWTHIVIQRRADNTVDIYFDGKLQTVTNGFYGAYIGFNLTANTIAKIGYGGYYTAGPMIVSNFRFTKNQQVYTGNFVPSANPLTSLGLNTKLLCCQGNDFVNRSDNEFTLVTSGSPKTLSVGPFTNTTPEYSVYFDGTGDYLSVASNDNIPKGNDSYTIECWFYHTGANQHIVSWGEEVANKANAIRTNTAGNGILHYWWSNDLDSGDIGLQRNSWNHIVAQFDGTTRKIYLNGIMRASDNPVGHNVTVTNNLKIGARINASDLLTGYISNLRIITGSALYTSNFTPSTESLTAITGTSLLTCKGTSITDLSPNNYTITVNGNTRVAINDPFVEYQYIGGGGSGLALQGGGGGVLGATDKAVSGLPNTGSGGGGSGGSGGSGVAIIKYPKTYRQPTETTGDVEIIETETDRIYKWNGSGTIKF